MLRAIYCGKKANLVFSRFSSSFKSFEEAKNALSSLNNEPDNVTKLKIYALFKQVSEGPCNKPKPGMMDFVGKAKWEAWNCLKDLTKVDAEKQYIELISQLFDGEKTTTASSSSKNASSEYEGLLLEKNSGIAYLTLNRPNKKNAITWEMYEAWIKAMSDIAKDDSTKILVITGGGEYFCSGNDLTNFTRESDIPKMVKQAKDVLQRFVAAFIDFPKPLIGLINGPAIGISVTTLALYDLVIASDKATFHAPLPQLGQTPEGCSSYTFPRLMGYSNASNMLLFNKKISAEEASKFNLVSQVLPTDDFEAMSKSLVQKYVKNPPQATFYSKDLLRANERAILHKVNKEECDRIAERWQSDECKTALMNFFSKGQKQ